MKTLSKGFVVFAGLLAAPLALDTPKQAPRSGHASDPRLTRLRAFLDDNECPINGLAVDFLEAADTNDLDWRLLPSISFVESGGGKQYMNNNVFGWANCERKFPSIKAGIHIVAERLANSKLYKDKDTDGILSTYNPAGNYRHKVKAVMEIIGSPDLGSSRIN